MPIRNSLVLYGAAILFVAIILVVRYAIAPAIVANYGLPGTLITLAVLFQAARVLDRQ